MSVISDNLIHFLGRNFKDNPDEQFTVCKSIFHNGLRPSNISMRFPDGSNILHQAVCFTDIPLKECNEHTTIYGKFGIGFKKSFVKESGGNPARYFVDYLPGQLGLNGKPESRGGFYHSHWQHFKFMSGLSDQLKLDPLFELHDKNGKVHLDNKLLIDLTNNFSYILSFDKEMGDLGPARDETKEIDLYYKEREWRLVPSNLDINSGRITLNEGQPYYKFTRKDVNMVVVPNEDIRVQILEFLLSLRLSDDTRLIEFGNNLLPIIHYDDLQKW